MTPAVAKRRRVGELRPSQLVMAFGVGSIVDLPNVSAMVMGLDDWPAQYGVAITEERLLSAVRAEVGSQVDRLLAPPPAPQIKPGSLPDDEQASIGVPVAPFPRWLVCPYCRLLAPIGSGLFELKTNPFRPEKTKYIHTNCRTKKAPPALPVRFLVACEHGHLDDFPWVEYVHQGGTHCKYNLQFVEQGIGGEAADVQVKCTTCNAGRSLVDAFKKGEGRFVHRCEGRRPHLRDHASEPCMTGSQITEMRPILLGASNSWFPITLSALTMPAKADRLAQLVADNWVDLKPIKNPTIIPAFREIGKLNAFAAFSDDQLWQAIELHRAGKHEVEPERDLKTPEYAIFSNPNSAPSTDNFRIRQVPVPRGYGDYFERVVLCDKLREVRALVGFTRIESPNEFNEEGGVPPDRRAHVSRTAPRWVPANEIRGEGIFVQFREDAIKDWLKRTGERAGRFVEAHKAWRTLRRLDPETGFPGMRFVLLHSFAHAIIRQLALECGYSAASLRERIYSALPEQENGPMAGVLIYTAAPDSEGTLGGLVAMGERDVFGRHLDHALTSLALCTSDPLCAEHNPEPDGLVLHGAACHACLFAAETSCERGNKYLDRSVLVPTVESHLKLNFFDRDD